MNTKKIKKTATKAVKKAQSQGKEIKKVAGKKYAQLKKEIKISPAKAKELEKKAIKELKKVEKKVEKTAKQAKSYAKKNPGKAALITLGVGAAVAGAALAFAGRKSSKKKRK